MRCPLRSATLALALLALVTISRADDKVRQETGVDAAVTQFGTTGQGVLVAILDRGLDWKSNDFRKADGTTRIKYIFDLTDDTGAFAAGNPYGMGTIYTEAQINSALTGGPTLATRDAVGHGTTTTGLAAGNGRNLASKLYRGMAPEASLIVVKVTSDGAPAHGSQPAEAAYYNYQRLFTAVDFVKAKAAELAMPCVMLLNLGSAGGPTDGTSDFARKIDATVGPGKQGLVFVTGSGDDGGQPNRVGGNIAQGGSASIQITKGVAGSLYFDLWHPDTDRFTVSIQTPNGTYGPYAPPANNSWQNVSNADFNYWHLGSGGDFYLAASPKREIWVRLDGPVGTYTINLQGTTVPGTGRFDANLNPSRIGTASSANKFTTFLAPGSIWDGATALYNICPNSYVIRNSWVDIDGITRNFTGQGTAGQLWTGSSVGPTFDGRLGIDISAPGDRTITSYSPTSWWGTFRFNLIQGGSGNYGMAGAVSAAAPVTTGIIALMLQRNPTLDAAQVKQILQQTAKSDAFTGTTPNTNWGYGKINALLAVQKSGKLATLTLSDSNPAGGTSITGTVTLNSAAPAGGTVVSLSNTNTAADLPGPTVTVAAGQTGANFTMTTDVVGADTAGTVTATLGAAQANAPLTVKASTAALTTLALTPTSVVGGGPVTGTVTLSPAPATDTIVTLTSSKPEATVPANVTVLAGQTTATFTVNTAAVNATLSAIISAKLGAVTKTATLSIKRLEVTAVGLTPALLAGGNASTGSVTLNGLAPAGGKSVALASDKAQATVPPTVTVLEGQKTATFTVNTSPVAAQVIASISATLAVTKTKALTIKPPALLTLKLAPTSVFGGTASTGTVTLNGPAPTGGIVVTLGSNKAEAAVPATVTVAAGQRTATFSVNTAVVYANVLATISSTGGGVTKTASLTVKSHLVKSVTLTPAVLQGGASSTGKVTLTAAAGPGGVVVTLSSDKVEATVSPSVTVPAGQTFVTFPVNTTTVPAQVKAIIKGTIGVSKGQATLTINM